MKILYVVTGLGLGGAEGILCNLADRMYEQGNVAVGGHIAFNTLFIVLKDNLSVNGVNYSQALIHRDFRKGGVHHGQKDISRIQHVLGYAPQFEIIQGINKSMS